MGIFDEIDKAMKKVGEGVKKADLDRHFKDPGTKINRAGSETSREIDKATTPAPQQPAARQPHPGYSRITAWMKTRYKGKIAGVTDPYQKNLELEMIATEACSGLSAKAKKGFLDYLKSQNYEQLLR